MFLSTFICNWVGLSDFVQNAQAILFVFLLCCLVSTLCVFLCFSSSRSTLPSQATFLPKFLIFLHKWKRVHFRTLSKFSYLHFTYALFASWWAPNHSSIAQLVSLLFAWKKSLKYVLKNNSHFIELNTWKMHALLAKTNISSYEKAKVIKNLPKQNRKQWEMYVYVYRCKNIFMISHFP